MNSLLHSLFRPVLALLALGLFSATSSFGAAVTLGANDSTGNSSFNSAGNWSNTAPPSAGNTYSDTGFNLRTPASSGSFLFAGDSLTISGGRLLYYGTGSGNTITINNFSAGPNGSTNTDIANGSGTTFTLAGSLSVSGTGSLATYFDLNNNKGINVSSNISGNGGLLVVDNGNTTTQDTNAIIFSGSNSYSGGTTVGTASDPTPFLIASGDGSLGTGNVTIKGGQLELELGTLNTYISSTATLTLYSTLANGAIDLNYTGTDVIAALSINGGTSDVANGTYGAVGSGALFTSALFEGTGTITVGAVPEPQTWALLLGGSLLLGAMARRSKVFSSTLS